MISGLAKPRRFEIETRSGISGNHLAKLDQNQINALVDKLYCGEIDPFHFLGGLVDQTESMDEAEKNYWFDILPSMTHSQTARLVEILTTEKRKLRELEIKYQKEIKALNKKYLAKATAHETAINGEAENRRDTT